MRSIIGGLITAELDSSTLMTNKDVFLLFIVCWVPLNEPVLFLIMPTSLSLTSKYEMKRFSSFKDKLEDYCHCL